jgi:membrane protease YdiL (CAAX protease family)
MIMQDPDPLLLAMAFFSAVVVAPICEEVAFRLLLQGWLEKVVGSRRKVVGSGQWAVGSETESDQQKLAATGRVAGEPETDGEHDNPYESPINQSDSFQPPDSSLQTNSSGYRPIFVSSLLFALAHYGHGPDPIPLFFLATILGYTYHRTHRIVPCIVAHALFNAFSLVTLMVMLFQAKQ